MTKVANGPVLYKVNFEACKCMQVVVKQSCKFTARDNLRLCLAMALKAWSQQGVLTGQ